MALAFVAFTDAFTGTAIDINPADVNIDACQAFPASQLPSGVANATRVWVRGVVHNVTGTLAATIAALIAGSTASGGGSGAMFYALMPSDNPGTVAGGAAVAFPNDGAFYGASPPTSPSSTSFLVPAAGTYEISFEVSVTEAGQLQLWRGLAGTTPVLESTSTRATGTSLITNTVLLTLVANELISVRNPTGAGTALTITPAAGAGQPAATSATLSIVKVDLAGGGSAEVLSFVSFTDADTGTTIDINPSAVNIDACQAVPSTQLRTGVANATRIWVREVVHNVVGTLAATIAALIAGSGTGGAVAPSNAIYVDLAGNNATGARGSAAFPFLTMQAAMGVAQSGDEILVSPGTFSGAFTLPAIANLIIRGAGEFVGDTILTAGAGIDVCTLNAANRSILFDSVQIAGLTTGRAVVGTGAASARAWLSNAGLVFEDCTLSSAAGNALDLTYANLVLIRDTIISGPTNLTVCSSVIYEGTAGGAILYSWDEADVLRPTIGQGTLSIAMGSIVGAITLAGLQGVGPVLTGGSPKLQAYPGTQIGTLTGLNLGDNAAAHLDIRVNGHVGAVDFQSTAAKALPAATANTLVLDFTGATLTGTGATAFLLKATTNFQTVFANGLISKTASTFTADAKIHLTLTGAALTSPSFPTPGADGDILPPGLNGIIDCSTGGAQVFTWAQLGYAGLIRVSSAVYTAHVTANIQGSDPVVPIAGKIATGFTITSTAQANTAANWSARWAA